MENDIDGGYLEIYPHGQHGEPERLEPNTIDWLYFLREHPHRVTKVTRGTRRAIAINLWDKVPSGLEVGDLFLEN